MEKKFVFVNKNILSNNIKIEKNEIGMISSESNNTYTISFVNMDTPILLNKNDVTAFDPHQTGDAFDFKICNRCNKLLPINMFDKNQNGKNNRTVRRPSCINCRKEIDGKSISSSDKKKWEKLKPNYIIWECPICKKKTIPGLTSKVVLDHNHITGKPRAWICDSCNTGLGRFKDDIQTMYDAIYYLKKQDSDKK